MKVYGGRKNSFWSRLLPYYLVLFKLENHESEIKDMIIQLPYYLVLFKPEEEKYEEARGSYELPYYLVLFKPEEEKYEEARGSYELPYYLVLFKLYLLNAPILTSFGDFHTT